MVIISCNLPDWLEVTKIRISMILNVSAQINKIASNENSRYIDSICMCFFDKKKLSLVFLDVLNDDEEHMSILNYEKALMRTDVLIPFHETLKWRWQLFTESWVKWLQLVRGISQGFFANVGNSCIRMFNYLVLSDSMGNTSIKKTHMSSRLQKPLAIGLRPNAKWIVWICFDVRFYSWLKYYFHPSTYQIPFYVILIHIVVTN